MSYAEDYGFDSFDLDDLFSSKWWYMANGEYIKPKDMSVKHRINTIALVARVYFENDIEKAISEIPILTKMHKLNTKGKM